MGEWFHLDYMSDKAFGRGNMTIYSTASKSLCKASLPLVVALTCTPGFAYAAAEKRNTVDTHQEQPSAPTSPNTNPQVEPKTGAGSPENTAPETTTPEQEPPTSTDDQQITVGEPKSKVPTSRGRSKGRSKSGARDKFQSDNKLLKDQRKGTIDEEAPSASVEVPTLKPLKISDFTFKNYDIPLFLLPIYQAAAAEYNIPWEILAAINWIETGYGENQGPSVANAVGWMQFLIPTWLSYGKDRNGDRYADPVNPADAITAAASYLKASGADKDLYKALYAYNHSDEYVKTVLNKARTFATVPTPLVASLTGLAQGRPPVEGSISYRGSEFDSEGNPTKTTKADNESNDQVWVESKRGSRVVAVNDGTVTKLSPSEVVITDSYGNRYRYTDLSEIASHYLTPKEPSKTELDSSPVSNDIVSSDPKPNSPASATKEPASRQRHSRQQRTTNPAPKTNRVKATDTAEGSKNRLYANPKRKSAYKHGGKAQILDREEPLSAGESASEFLVRSRHIDPNNSVKKVLKVGSQIASGTVLGKVAEPRQDRAAGIGFEIKPLGEGTPNIPAAKILDTWRIYQTKAFYQAPEGNPFKSDNTLDIPTLGQMVLMSKEDLERTVLQDPRVTFTHKCMREDVLTGQVDRRVLLALETLAWDGLHPTVVSLKCFRHGSTTPSGRLSLHSDGNAVDIGMLNGKPVLGNQGSGSLAEKAVKRLATLPGFLAPQEILSLIEVKGKSNVYVDPVDHSDHIHFGVSRTPADYEAASRGSDEAKQALATFLKPSDWMKLVERLSKIDTPLVAQKPSKYAVRVKGRKTRKPQ